MSYKELHDELSKRIIELEESGDLPGSLSLANKLLELNKTATVSDRNIVALERMLKDEEDLEDAINYTRRMIQATGDYKYSITDTVYEFDISVETIQQHFTQQKSRQ